MDKIEQDIAPQNFRAFFVTKHDGGWVADLLLHSPLQRPLAPLGSLDVVGTPDALPYSTHDEAFVAGVEMIALLLAYAQSPSTLRI